MQNYTIRFVESLIARISASGCSIASALEVELRAITDPRALLKLRDAGLDLARIVELEIIRRDDPDPPTSPECVGCGRVMSQREALEQGACNDCRPSA